jgi:hypothetical protein
MAIQGTVPVGGSFAPTDPADSFGTHNDKWGIGGYRIVKNLEDRALIPVNESGLLNLDDPLASGRKKLGMMVYVSDEAKFYVLTIDTATWDGYTEEEKVTALADDTNFVEFSGGGGGILYGTTTYDEIETYTVTVDGIVSSYETGDSYLIKFNANNIGNTKLNINGVGEIRMYKDGSNTFLEAGDIIADKIYLITFDGSDFQLVTLGGGPGTTPTLQQVLTEGNETDGVNIKLINDTAIELDNGSLLRKGSYNFGNYGDIIVSGITDAGTGLIANISGWGDIGGTKWSDLNGTYIKTSVAVTPSGYGDGFQGMHTPVADTFNYYLQLLGNTSFNGIAYFLAPGNRSGWGSDPDDDDNTDAPVNYWRLLVGADDPYCYFTNPSTDIYNFPTTGWVPVDDKLTLDEGLNGYDYIATYDSGFTATLSNIINGSGGISRICGVGYEDMWQAGIRYVFGNSGTIREATNCFDYIPDSSFDVNKRFAVGSRWVLDNGDVYTCTDNTSNAATWVKIKVSAGTGGGGVVYYLNFDTAGESPLTNIPTTPNTPKKLGLSGEVTPTSYQSAHLPTGSYAFLASFVTDVGFPSAETIPAGIWDFNIFAESSSTNSANQVYFQVKIYQYDDTETLTLLGTSSDVYIYDPQEINQYVASVIVPQTTILTTDRIVVYIYGRSHQNNKHLTLHFGGNYPSHVHTTLPSISGTGFVTVTNGIFDSTATATIAVTKGGTGFTSYAVGDLLYANTTTSLAKLAGVATGSVLISNGIGVVPSWSNSPALRSLILNNGTNANTITLNTGATAANYTLTLPTAAPAAGQYLQFAVGGVATWVAGTVNGVTTMAAIGAVSNANGASIASSTLTLQPANASFGGVVTTGTQTFAGAKTLSSALTISATASQLVLGTTNTTTITSLAPAASRVYTIPDVLVNASFVMTAANQTIAGNKTFSAATTFSLAGSLGNAITLSGNGDSTNAAIKFTGAQPRWIDYGNAGGSAPSLVSRSDGTKIVLANVFAAGTFTDFAIGMTSNSIWTGCANNTASYGFEWYGGSTLAMTLKGDGNLTLVGDLTIPNSKNIVLGTGAGTKIGTATNQLLGFHNSTPTIQRASVSQAAVATTTPTLAAYGYTLAQATAIITLVNEMRAALVEKGLIKGSA